MAPICKPRAAFLQIACRRQNRTHTYWRTIHQPIWLQTIFEAPSSPPVYYLAFCSPSAEKRWWLGCQLPWQIAFSVFVFYIFIAVREPQAGAIDTAVLLIQRDTARIDWPGASDLRARIFKYRWTKHVPIRYRFWVGRCQHFNVQACNRLEVILQELLLGIIGCNGERRGPRSLWPCRSCLYSWCQDSSRACIPIVLMTKAQPDYPNLLPG